MRSFRSECWHIGRDEGLKCTSGPETHSTGGLEGAPSGRETRRGPEKSVQGGGAITCIKYCQL